MIKEFRVGNVSGILLCGGEDYRIQVKGKIYTFELHPYCGPTVITHKGDPASVQPVAVLAAASDWLARGKPMENGLCVWYHEPKPILKHIGGRHWMFMGEHPPERGT